MLHDFQAFTFISSYFNIFQLVNRILFCVGIHSNPHEFGIFHVKGNTLGPDVIQAFFEAQKNRLAGFGCVRL